MGVITLALVAHGSVSAQHFHVPAWVVVSAASAIALGTYAGGWRIIRTVGTRIIKMDIAQGFTAQGAGAAVILASSHFGYPLSTTHVISGGMMGAGAAKRFSAVRWGVAGNIAAAWLLTLPAAGLAGAVAYGVANIFGTGALGPILITILAIGALRWRSSPAGGWPRRGAPDRRGRCQSGPPVGRPRGRSAAGRGRGRAGAERDLDVMVWPLRLTVNVTVCRARSCRWSR